MILDLNYLDGLEINCHQLYDGSHLNYLSSVSNENNLILTCGGDFHNDTHRAKCGVYFDDTIITIEEVVEYLRLTSTIKMCIQEPDFMLSFDFVYEK